jgi:hypothetical protein
MEPSGTMEDPQDSRSSQSVSELQFGIVSDSAQLFHHVDSEWGKREGRTGADATRQLQVYA